MSARAPHLALALFDRPDEQRHTALVVHRRVDVAAMALEQRAEHAHAHRLAVQRVATPHRLQHLQPLRRHALLESQNQGFQS